MQVVVQVVQNHPPAMPLAQSGGSGGSSGSLRVASAGSSASRRPHHASEATEVATPRCGRACAHCHKGNTPMWRNGPVGPQTLCNACGIRWVVDCIDGWCLYRNRRCGTMFCTL